MPGSSSGSIEIPTALTRTVDLLGEDGVRRLMAASVVVAGLGGVGSHAAMALARSGVGRLRLIDHDVVTSSSLNRHALALAQDVGRPKVEIVAERIVQLGLSTQVEPVLSFIDGESLDATALGGEPDYVVDAIDSLTPKVALLRRCVERGLAVISSMGAAGRLDPTALRVAPLSQTDVCPLARLVRKRLRKQLVPLETITAVYSLETPLAPLPPDLCEPGAERGRQRHRQPSLATIPAIFGYTLASVVIRELARGARSSPPELAPR